MLRLSPLGDRALLLTLGDAVDEPTRRRVRAAWSALAASAHPAVTDLVPAYASVAVHYDPRRVATRAGEPPHDAMARWAAACVEHARPVEGGDGRLVEIPVVYGGEGGPDLEDVATTHGLSAGEIIARHTAPDYVVHFLGFMPGFAYLGGLDATIATPRRAVPRAAVPAGSVGIGGAQTGVYPVASPGGWQLIGRTTLALFDPSRTPATLLAAGDRVRFVAVEA